MTKKIPEGLIEELNRGNLVLFVGAGISKPSGLPNWSELMQKMIDWTKYHCALSVSELNKINKLLEDKDYLTLSEELRKKMGKSHFFNFMYKVFRSKELQPNELHKLFTNINFAAIWTTNYDNLLESAYNNKLKKQVQIYYQNTAPALAAVCKERSFYILKTHGNIENIQTVVLGRKDYEDLIFANKSFEIAYQNLFIHNTILFVGYSLEDPDIQQILTSLQEAFKGNQELEYALMPNISDNKIKMFKEKYNIQVIPYTPSDFNHPEIIEFFKELQRRTCFKYEPQIDFSDQKRYIIHNLPPANFYVPRGKISSLVKKLSKNNYYDWIIGIIGPPGVGKSSLALELAYHLRYERLFDIIIWVTAENYVLTPRGIKRRDSAVSSMEDIYDIIAQTLNRDEIIQLASEQQKYEEIKQIFKSNRCLLIIDDIKTENSQIIINKVKGLISPSKVVVTSQIPISSLVDFEIGVSDIKLGIMSFEEAKCLLEYECDHREIILAEEEKKMIINFTGRHPLALIWSISQIELKGIVVNDIIDRLKKAKGEIYDYCFGQAVATLTPRSKQILQIMTLFINSASRCALEKIGNICEEDRFGFLQELIDRSLLRIDRNNRYNILSLTKYLVINRLEEIDKETKLRYCNFFLEMSKQYNKIKSGQDIEELKLDFENILSAIDWCEQQDDINIKCLVPEFIDALHNFLWLEGYWNKLVKYSKISFKICQETGDLIKAGLHAYHVAFTRFQQGEFEETKEWGMLSLKIMEQTKNEYYIAYVKRVPAMVARAYENNYEKSKKYLVEMLESGKKLLLKNENPERIMEIKDNICADALTTLANLERDLKRNYSKAERLYKKAILLNEELDNHEKQGLNYNHLGRVFIARYRMIKYENEKGIVKKLLEEAENNFIKGKEESIISKRSDQILIGMYGLALVEEGKENYVKAKTIANEALEKYSHSGAAEIKEMEELLNRINQYTTIHSSK
ncbi:MAG: SIR2 family protein [Thermoplasmata archaeon]|nr:MAG: SIR2 family protein [Thermoplasmata archaeon]